ncbi:hypothetical protein [Thiothrix sp.]|jgi:hypothetical protein|uniref:hypothetical protein n=1 Tax=Thiothrix sp. TaxID=1032 RepID=UPI00257A7829|nr:hypothetical protein [Thiothrix sp.]
MKFAICPSSLEYASINANHFGISVLMSIANMENGFKINLDDKNILVEEYGKIIKSRNSDLLKIWLESIIINRCYIKTPCQNEENLQKLIIEITRKPFNCNERNIISNNLDSFEPYRCDIETYNIRIITPDDAIKNLNKEYAEFKYSELKNDILFAIEEMMAKIKTARLEDLHNDILISKLRRNGFNSIYRIEEQVREGISKNNSVGELDAIIKDSSNSRKAIIEALRSSSCGNEDNDISYHLNKLLNNYNTIGMRTNYLIVYCEAKNFDQYWSKYKNYIDKINDKSNFSKETPLVLFEDTNSDVIDLTGIRVGRSIHTKDGREVEVYHIVCKFYYQIEQVVCNS